MFTFVAFQCCNSVIFQFGINWFSLGIKTASLILVKYIYSRRYFLGFFFFLTLILQDTRGAQTKPPRGHCAAVSQKRTGVKCEVWHRPWESSQPSGIILTYCFTHERAPSIFHILSNQGCTDTCAPGDLPTMLSVSCSTSGRDSLLVCACANVWSWHALSHAHLLNMLTFHEYFSAVSTSEPASTHSFRWASLMCWLSAERCSQWQTLKQASVWVWSLFPSPCQDIPQDLVLNPDAFFLKFLRVHQLLSDFHKFESCK